MPPKAPQVVSRMPAINLIAVFRSLIFNAISLPVLFVAGFLVMGFGLNSLGIFGEITKHVLLMAEVERVNSAFWFESLMGSIFVLSLVLAMIAPLRPEQPEMH